MRHIAKLVFLSLLLLSLLGSGSLRRVHAGLNVWTSNGPEGEGGETVVALAVDPSNANTVYAVTYGGVFKSTDGGGSWGAIDFGMPINIAESFAIDPSDRNTMYAALKGYGGVGQEVVKSTNGGASWSKININGLPSYEGVHVLAIAPSNTSIIYAGAGDHGYFKSTNSGGNWSAVNTGMPTYIGPFGVVGFMWAYGLAVDPNDPNTVYAQIAAGYGTYKTTNGGASWSAINYGLTGGGLGAMAIDPSDTQTIYTSDFGVCKTTDGGGTWRAVNTNLSLVRALVIDPRDTNTIYAGADYQGVFKSTDGGGSWSAFNTGLINLRVFAFAIDPTSATLYAGTFGGGVFQQQFNGGAPANPEITQAVFDGRKKLTIWGSDFKNSPRVMINEVDRTEFVRSASETTIKIKGKPSALGLNLGDNTIRVIDSTGAASNVVILRL